MKKKFNIKQFTLIELIIVIVVIGILAGMALPKFIGMTKDAKVAAMNQDLDVLEKAVQLYESTNDGLEPFIKDNSNNYAKVSVTRQTLKDTLDSIGDDESNVYTLDIDSLKPYLERLKYADTTTDTYLYSTKTNVAINEQGKIDSSGITHHILNGVNGTSTSSTTKSKITLMGNSSYSRSPFVIIDNSVLYGLGDNSSGQFGNGTTDYGTHSTPTKIEFTNGIKPTQIVCGGYHTMEIDDNGNLYTWGDNSNGQLGDGTNYSSSTPIKIELASGIKATQIACCNDSSMAIGSDGELYTWGKNDCGQLGDGTNYDSSLPMKIELASGIKPTQIACGGGYSMAIGSDGNLYTWGINGNGQLGDGTTDEKDIPTNITVTSGIKPTHIACGDESSVAIGDDGRLYTWGYNGEGELGIGTTDNDAHSTPIEIELASGIKPTQIACGAYYLMAIGDNGKVYIWGTNGYFNLDRPTEMPLSEGVTTDQFINGQIYGTDEVVDGVNATQIACGDSDAMVIGSDNKLYCYFSF